MSAKFYPKGDAPPGALRCGGCRHASDKRKERMVAWCLTLRCMVSTATLVVCSDHKSTSAKA